MSTAMVLEAQSLDNFQYERNWGNCPTEILMLLFSYLDIKSLSTCMFVNNFWLDAVKYYLQHYKLWRQMVEETISNRGVLYMEKSKLQWREILLNYFLWRKVWKARVAHYQSFHIKHVKAMKVYKNSLIVVLEDKVKYLNLLTTFCNKTLDVKCYSYEESDYLITILSKESKKDHHKSLFVQNKRYNMDLQYCDIFKLDVIGCYKLYSNCCYFIDRNNTLWVAKLEPHNFFCVKGVAKFYGPSRISVLHVFEEKVYIVTKEGILYYMDGIKFKKLHSIFHHLHAISSPLPLLYLFNDGWAAYKAPASEKWKITKSLECNRLILAIPNLSALFEHGEVVFVGYESGKIEIHSIYKIRRCLYEPLRQFHMRDFVYDIDANYRVHALDVHERNGRHYLVVAIENNVHQLTIQLR